MGFFYFPTNLYDEYLKENSRIPSLNSIPASQFVPYFHGFFTTSQWLEALEAPPLQPPLVAWRPLPLLANLPLQPGGMRGWAPN